ncbi:hypothetical protein HMI55_000793 [Coelomomyces lativittatus]|nr:hypothetical protein HMI55_000793 [Coelomomyces lativittatus]
MQAWSQASPYDQQMFFMCMERLPGTTTTSTDLKKASQTLHSVVTEPEVQEAMLDPVIHSYLQCLKQGIPFTNMNSLRQPEIQRKLHLLVQKGVIELQS